MRPLLGGRAGMRILRLILCALCLTIFDIGIKQFRFFDEQYTFIS